MLVKKATSTINVLKVEQSFQVSCEFKLNEGMMLSFKFALLFWLRKRFLMSQSGLSKSARFIAGFHEPIKVKVAQATWLFLLY